MLRENYMHYDQFVAYPLAIDGSGKLDILIIAQDDIFFSIYRGIDYALSKGDVPSIAPCLPLLIQQVI